MEDNKYRKARIIIQVILLILVLALCIFAIIKLYPIFIRIQDDVEYRDEVIAKIKSYGSFSWLILILAQIVQTVLAVIPSAPIVIITGILYKPFIAVIICLVGQTLGALVVIGLVKLFGNNFISLFIDPKQTKKFKILQDEKRCAVLMFSYLLIPGLPKDIIAFIVPFTKVKVRHFIWINLIARTPLTVVSVLLGDSLKTGNYTLAIVIASCSAVLAIFCLIFNKKIVSWIDRLTSKKSSV